MAHSDVSDGGDGFHVWRMAVNILKNQLLIANTG